MQKNTSQEAQGSTQMNWVKLFIVGIFMISLLANVSAVTNFTWTSNSTIVLGLPDLGTFSTPKVFEKDESLYLISGENGGVSGFVLAANGTTWLANTSITNGIVFGGTRQSIIEFQHLGNWYAVGSSGVSFFGYALQSNGTWVTNTTAKSGLSAASGDWIFDTFIIGTDRYLVLGDFNGDWYGFVWNGAGWTSNSTIISGLTDVGIDAAPTVKNIDGEIFMLVGNQDVGNFGSYKWGGSGWSVNLTLNSTLYSIGLNSVPTMFNISSNYYMISGSNAGNFTGFNLPLAPPTPSLSVTLNAPANNSQLTANSVFFNASILPNTFSLTNATVNIWFNNGTFFTSQTNTTFNGNISTFNVSMIRGNFLWNVLGVQGNGVGLNSSYASNNFTFAVNKINFYGQLYDSSILESSAQTIKINASIFPGFSISAVNITYNNTNYTASFSTINATDYLLSASPNSPAVGANANVTFFFWVFFTDSSFTNSTPTIQTVLNFGIDNCSTNTIQIMNLTLKDEDTQTSLNAANDNTSIKINMNIYSDKSLSNSVFQFSKFYNETLPARVCANSTLGNSIFYMNSQIEYSATNYATEFYNIQNYSLNASNNPSENITLYDLLSSRDQVFIISYRDSNFLPVPDALIQIGRLYVDEGLTKTIEVPITDSSGQSVGNLVLNNVIYTFTVTKYGKVLAIFTNQLAKCQNPLITTCSIELNSFSSSIAVSNFTLAADFLYTLTYNKGTRAVTTIFTIPSGAVSNVLLNVTGADALSTFLCSQNVTTSSGTLTCTLPGSFGNQTAYATLYKDGVQIAFGQISSEQTPGTIYAGILVFIGLLIMLTMIGAAVSDNPVYTAIFLLVGFGLLVALNLVASNGFIGALATILWLVLAIIIIAIKGGNRT